MRPVTTQPMEGVMLKRWVMVEASMSLSCERRQLESCLKMGRGRTATFFCVITTAVSFPRTAMDVYPEPEIALNAYSVRPSQSVSLG